MRMSQLFGQTRRQAPADAELASHALLIRAGFIRPLAAGVFSYLPLAVRSLAKIENLMRHEIEAIGGQEVSMPVVQPADLWQATGRWDQIGAELTRLQDRNGRQLVLAMTHEEVVGDLARGEIHSYRELPKLIFHIQTKWRDDPRPRGGLIRVREFTMKDSYSLDADLEGLDRQYRNHYQAYFNIFHRCGLPVIAVRSDVGVMGGSMAHEFMYMTPVGEDTLLLCQACGYRANRQVASMRKERLLEEELRPVEQVATPGVETIEALAAFLEIPLRRTAKAVFWSALVAEKGQIVEKPVLALIRGDLEINEAKLANAVGTRELRPATTQEIEAMGAVPGYASPIGVGGALVVVDDSIPMSPNLVAGANREGFHLRHVNFGRDFDADQVVDIAVAGDGDLCPECGQPMTAWRGVEVGNIFKLGTRYSQALGATFADHEGVESPIVMGSYGIGSGRLLACVAEHHHDEHGLRWPISVAPYEVHLVGLKGGEAAAEGQYHQLTNQGVEVLFDDRDETPGVKFADADLIGNPIRVTLSRRSLERGGVEVKLRGDDSASIVSEASLIDAVRERLGQLQADLEARLGPVPFDEKGLR